MAKDNVALGRFQLQGIPPAPRGVPQIEVTFDIDANGILHVSAKDKATGKEQSMQVVAPNKMSRDDIEKKVKEAEEFAEADKKELEKVKVRNDAEAMIYTTEHTVKQFKDKVPKELADKIEKARAALQEVIEKEDYDGMKAKMDELRDVLQEIGKGMYGQGQGPEGGGPGPESGQPGQSPEPGAGGDGDTVDANFKVEK